MASVPRAAPSTERSVPVIILNWNGWEDSFECLRSLSRAPDVSVVWLVDNASDEDRSAEALRLLKGLRYLRFDDNFGFAGGYNRALRMARAEGYGFAYLLNNDTVVLPGFLSSVLEVAENNPGLACVGSVLLHGDTNVIEHDGRYHSHGTKPWKPPANGGAETLTPWIGLRRPEFTSGAGMLVRLDAMERFGYFDERFFFCWEDTEWCWRLERCGFPSAICLNSLVRHKGGGSDRNGNAVYYRTRNRFLLAGLEDSPQRLIRRLFYEAAVLAECVRREGDWECWLALAAALDDAMGDRVGKRSTKRVGMRPVVRLAILSLIAHLHDKWRSLRGLPAGYGEGLRYP